MVEKYGPVHYGKRAPNFIILFNNYFPVKGDIGKATKAISVGSIVGWGRGSFNLRSIFFLNNLRSNFGP
jgi:hypothetical protein